VKDSKHEKNVESLKPFHHSNKKEDTDLFEIKIDIKNDLGMGREDYGAFMSITRIKQVSS
jgi:hypothetical protein